MASRARRPAAVKLLEAARKMKLRMNTKRARDWIFIKHRERNRELPPNNSGDAIETLQRVDRRRVAVHRRPGGA